jgi:predicted dehydrogenase
LSVSRPVPVEAVMVGAGNRGWRVYGDYARAHPGDLHIVGVVEPDEARRERFAELVGLGPDQQFRTWDELVARPQLATAAINATLDRTHHPSTLALLEAGYDVLLEKPIATSSEECLDLVETAERLGRHLQISHVLRYAPFFSAIHDAVRSGSLGEVSAVDWRENLVYWHYVHSFVRGNWAHAATTGPMLLTKCCHDLDLLVWLFGPCERIASFGEQRHFTAERVGPEVPARCLDGCPYAETCNHYAPRVYLDRLAENPKSFAVSAITLDPSPDGIMRALAEGPYGRCAYRCGVDVVDHQVVLMQFGGGQAVSLTMNGASHVEGRTVRIDGTRATLLANEARREIEVHTHASGETRRLDIPEAQGGHGGGDWGLIRAFLDGVRGMRHDALTSARESVESHFMAFAAEEARLGGVTVDMAAYRARVAERLHGRVRV